MKDTKKRFIIILADGARWDVFQELFEQGQLPAMQEYFLQQGSFAKATSVFPSTTGPAYLPFLTGCFPGTCNLPGIRWFDKAEFGRTQFSLKRFRSYVGFESFLINHDINPNYKTLFEYLPKSYNIFSALNRGVSTKGNVTSHMRLWYWYYAHLTDRWHLVDHAAMEKTLSVIQKDFEFLFVVFPGIDEYSHLSHPRHEHTIRAYQKLDESIQKITSTLKREKKFDETAIFIVSDHGLSETKQHFGVGSFLESKGLKTFYYPKIFKWGFEAASMVSGNAMLHLYFKGTRGWTGRMPYEELQEQYSWLVPSLLENPAVDLLAAEQLDGSVRVLSRNGEATLRQTEAGFFLQNHWGKPLGLPDFSEAIDISHALAVTVKSPYPDSIVQIVQLFRSARTGDLVVSAAPGYDLRKRFEHHEHKSSHGALHAEHMWTPLLSSVPIQNPVVRSVDVFPTILNLRGLEVPNSIDGVSLI